MHYGSPISRSTHLDAETAVGAAETDTLSLLREDPGRLAASPATESHAALQADIENLISTLSSFS